MGVIPVRNETSAPPTGGGAFSLTVPTVGNLSQAPFVAEALYGDWIYAVGVWRNPGSYPVGGFTFGGTTGSTWHNEGIGPSIGGIDGCQILSGQLGIDTLTTLTGSGPGTNDVCAALFIIIDNKPPITIIVGGIPTLVHQYVLQDSSFVSNSGLSLALPPFTVPGGIVEGWSYVLLSAVGDIADYTFDGSWRNINDGFYPSQFERDLPPEGTLTFAPGTIPVAADMSLMALAFSDDGVGYESDRILDARRTRPEYINPVFQAGGGIRLL